MAVMGSSGASAHDATHKSKRWLQCAAGGSQRTAVKVAAPVNSHVMGECFLVLGAGTSNFNGVYVMDDTQSCGKPTYAKMHGSEVLIHSGGFWRLCGLVESGGCCHFISFYALEAHGPPPDHGWELKRGRSPLPRVQRFSSISSIPAQLQEPGALQWFSLRVQGSGTVEYDGVYHIRGLRCGKACYCKENSLQTIMFHNGWWVMNESGTGESRYGCKSLDAEPFPADGTTWVAKSGRAPAPRVAWTRGTAAFLESSQSPVSLGMQTGMHYRFTPNEEDKDLDGPVAAFGAEIDGELVGENWVKVLVPRRGVRYLPLALGDPVVLRQVGDTEDACCITVPESHRKPEAKAPEVEVHARSPAFTMPAPTPEPLVTAAPCLAAQQSAGQSAPETPGVVPLAAAVGPALSHMPYFGKVTKESGADLDMSGADNVKRPLASAIQKGQAICASDGVGTHVSTRGVPSDLAPRFVNGMEATLRMKLERQQSKERNGESASISRPRPPAAANIQILDARLAERLARQREKERTGESAVEATRKIERTSTLGSEPEPVAQEQAREFSEVMPPPDQLPRLLGARTPNHGALLKKPGIEDSMPPLAGDLVQRGPDDSSRRSTGKLVVAKPRPDDGLVSQRKLIFNRGLSFQTVSVSHR